MFARPPLGMLGGAIGPNGLPINAWNPVTPNWRNEPVVPNVPVGPAPAPFPQNLTKSMEDPFVASHVR